MRFMMLFEHVSEEAFEQVIEDAPGKPFIDQQGEDIGVITSSYKTGGELQVAEFNVELNDMGRSRYVQC